MNTNIKVGECFGLGWSIFKEHMGSAIGASLLVMLMGGVTWGIGAPAMLGGFFLLADAWITKRQPVPGAGDVFKGFTYFLPTLVAVIFLVLVQYILSSFLLVVPVLGWILLCAMGLIVYSLQFWVVMVVVNQRISGYKAFCHVLTETCRNRFWKPILVGILANMLVVVGIIAALAGALVCGIGVIFTFPFGLCVYAAAYRKLFDAPEVEVVA